MFSLSLGRLSLGASVQSHAGQLSWKVETPISPEECKCVFPTFHPVNTWKGTSTLWPWTGFNGCRRWMDILDAGRSHFLSSQMSHLSTGSAVTLTYCCQHNFSPVIQSRLFQSRGVDCHIKCGLWDVRSLIQWNTCKCRCQCENRIVKATHCSVTFNWHSLKGSD